MAKRTAKTAPRKRTTKKAAPANPLKPNRRTALNLAMKLLAIPGGSGDELAVVKYIQQQLKRAGAPAASMKVDNAHTKTPLPGNTGNLVLKLRGNRPGPRRMLMAHMDTVPICVGCEPVIDGELIRSANPETGLGGDDRAGTAVLLHTAMTILKQKLPHPPLTFCWMIQEEVGLQGARNVDKRLLGDPQFAFNFDGGSASKLIIGATGGYRMDITVTGLASHAGVAPQEGVSAIAIASLAIADLQRSGWHGDVRKKKGTGTSNIGVISGGAATNVVTDRVTLRAEARSHDPQFRTKILQRIEKAFKRAAKEVVSSEGKRGTVEIASQLDYESFLLKKSQPSVTTARKALEAAGLKPEWVIANGGLDANWMTQHGIPTVSLGCGQQDIHTVKETVDIEQYLAACEIAMRLATSDNNAI